MTIFPPDPDFDALRLELARLRAARGWTYDELAARSGLARRTLIEIEQGRTIGTLNTWHALAHALSTPDRAPCRGVADQGVGVRGRLPGAHT